MQTGRLKNRQRFRQHGGSLVKSFVYDDTVVETSSLFLSPSSVEALAPPSKPGERSCFSELRQGDALSQHWIKHLPGDFLEGVGLFCLPLQRENSDFLLFF